MFRSYQPFNLGLVFGKGLTPFAIVCEGQPEADKVKLAVNKARIVEGGASVTLADAGSLVTKDCRLVAEPDLA